MSLTNDQITALNFQDYHRQILPYLNGQVPTFANAFNRSDLYSTDEKIVGTWIDGKPLYQKTFDMGSNKQISYTAWTDSGISTSNLNIDKIVAVIAASTDQSAITSGIATKVKVHIDSNKFQLQSVASYADETRFFTLQYTKVGDTPIKVGTGNDYSTDEQIIGTWVDGKPLYQRTWTGLSISVTPGSTSWIVMTGINIPNGKLIDAIFLTDMYIKSIPQQCWIRPATGNLETTSWAESRTIATITVRYTKAS